MCSADGWGVGMKKKKITDEQYARAEANGISRRLLNDRVGTKGWDIERAINTPKMASKIRERRV